MEADVSVKSRPIYPQVQLNEKSTYQLFIAQADQLSPLLTLFNSCCDSTTQQKQLLVVKSRDAESAEALAVGAETDEPASQWIEASQWPDKLNQCLNQAPLTTSLYIAGEEAFLWDVHNLATKAGLVAEQIHMLKPKPGIRRVFCTHCYNIMEEVDHSPVSCSGCHRLLLVRDHFSRLQGAYVGVIINAEDPSDIPPKEALV